ncbi:MAG: DUF6318 family protein [Mycobacteriales bacterium]
MPPAALAQTQQGADAFVRYFFQQMNVAFSRSDPNLISSLQNGHCVTCDNYEKALASARDGGRYIRGDSFTVADVAAAPPQGDAAQVEVFGSVPARAQVDGSGRVVEALKAVARFHLIVTVQRGAAGWLVSDIALGSS